MYDVQGRLDEVARELREAGYRLTPQRLAVLEALLQDEGHPSAETVYARIHDKLPTTSLATVYNTLDALRDIGQVLEVRPGQGPVRYDVRQPQGHPHLLCTRCGRVEDAPPSVAAGPRPSAAAVADGWQELDVRLDFQGVCPSCKRKEEASHGR